jgi:ferric-dicitrate binding protein FerR (iron transport regulator)
MQRRLTLQRTVRASLALAALAVSLGSLSAQDFDAKVIVQNGSVSTLENGFQTPLSLNSVVKRRQVIVTGPDGYAKFQVSDGSTFEVFNNAKVVFRETPGDFQHLLNVWIGRVKVMIQHAPGKPNPNNVSTPTAVISVRGTVFDVEVEDPDGTTLVTVDEGIVDVRNQTALGNSVTLTQGASVRVYRNQPLAQAKDRGAAWYQIAKGARDLFYQVMIGRQGGSGGGLPVPGGGTSGGAQGDKGKGGGTTTTPGAPPGTPGAPPGAPGAPPGGGD